MAIDGLTASSLRSIVLPE